MLWDLNDGKHLHTLDHNDIITALCFSPNRYWLCAAYGPSIKIWVRTVTRILSLVGHQPLHFIMYCNFSFSRTWNLRTWLRSCDLKLSLLPTRPSLHSVSLWLGQLMDKLCLLVTQTILLGYGRFLCLCGEKLRFCKVLIVSIV